LQIGKQFSVRSASQLKYNTREIIQPKKKKLKIEQTDGTVYLYKLQKVESKSGRRAAIKRIRKEDS
jgi:hypothetical protein